VPGQPRECVLVRRVDDIATTTNEALDFLDYNFTDKKVWVKPNLLGPHPPKHGATTDPELVARWSGSLSAAPRESLSRTTRAEG